MGLSPRGLELSRVKWRLGGRPVRLGCLRGWDRGRRGGRGQAKRIDFRRLLEAELSKRKLEAGLSNQQGWGRDREPSVPGNLPSGRGAGGKR